MTYEAMVRVGKGKRVRRIRFAEEGLVKGMHVVVTTDRGTEIATLTSRPWREGEVPALPLSDGDAMMRMDARQFFQAATEAKELRELTSGESSANGVDPAERATFVRRATGDDVARVNALMVSTEVDEFDVFAREIAALGLPMKPVQVEHLLGGERILFFFTSEDRVDFRELVRRLASQFRARIELRRIQSREAAAMMGGMGVCGKELCCSTHLKVLKPVTIKMARDQGRPVSSDSNLGACGRLRCCLRYELDGYEKEGAGCSGCSIR